MPETLSKRQKSAINTRCWASIGIFVSPTVGAKIGCQWTDFSRGCGETNRILRPVSGSRSSVRNQLISRSRLSSSTTEGMASRSCDLDTTHSHSSFSKSATENQICPYDRVGLTAPRSSIGALFRPFVTPIERETKLDVPRSAFRQSRQSRATLRVSKMLATWLVPMSLIDFGGLS